MKKYFYLQLKRLWRIFPLLLGGLLISLACVGVLAAGMWKNSQSDEDKQRFAIAITGDTQGDYVQMGMMALQAFDDTRFAMEIVEMSEEDARVCLMRGSISAYVVLPENFIERALRGDMDTVTYVTHAGKEDVVTMFKDELTKLITDMVVYTQKGVYAVAEIVEDNEIPGSVGWHMDTMSLSYIDLILSRSQICVVEELGVATGLDTVSYYICSLVVFLLLFIGVAFVTVGVRKDKSLSRLLASRGFSEGKQVFYEFAAQFTVLFTLGAVLTVIVSAVGPRISQAANFPGFGQLLLRTVPVAAMAAAGNMLIFEMTGNVIGAAVWHFFLSVGQCYVAGCFYPVYALPEPLQKAAAWMPAGMAREFLSGSFLLESQGLQLAGILLVGSAFFGITVVLRRGKLLAERG